jgi:hypothetical protein
MSGLREACRLVVRMRNAAQRMVFDADQSPLNAAISATHMSSVFGMVAVAESDSGIDTIFASASM